MKPVIPVPHIVLTDPRTVPGALARVIADMVADVDRRIAAVAVLDARLGIELAKKHLGMMCPSMNLKMIHEQLDAEISGLVTVRRTLDGLRAIEAARSALQDSEDAQHAAAEREKASAPAPVPCFDPRLGRLVTPASA